jgi:hypothetical protein
MSQAPIDTLDIQEAKTLSATQIINFTERLIELHPDQIPNLLDILQSRLERLS